MITFVGTRESIGEAALRGIGKAAELIDLNHQRGAIRAWARPTLCRSFPSPALRSKTASASPNGWRKKAWRRFQIPTYLYEAAARRPERGNLENIRRGQFEGVREEVRTNPERLPDFGEAALHPTAGATVVGARKFLIAYNINLNTPDVALAKAIAKKIRASSGGFPCVKAMGVELKARNLAQVSMNLTDFETTSMATVFDAVSREAAAQGVAVLGSEIIGLVPRRALEDTAVQYLKMENYHPQLVFENRLEQIIRERAVPAPEGTSYLPLDGRGLSSTPWRRRRQPRPAEVSRRWPGALAAALGEMVCGVSLNRHSLAAHHPTTEGVAAPSRRTSATAARKH